MTSRILQQDSGLILTEASEPIINEDFIGADGFSTGNPVLQTTAITQDHVTNVISIVTGQPVISTTTITQDHVINLSPIVTGQPVVPTTVITQDHDLTVVSFVTGSPVVLTTPITQDHDLTVVSFVAGSPVVSDATVTENESFSILPVVTGTPEVNPTTITQHNVLSANGILTGRPEVEDATDPNIIFEQVEEKMLGGWPKRLFEHTELAVSRGFTKGHTAIYKFGYNPDVNGDEETVWSYGGNYPWLDNPVTMFISSTSANDASGGTGANTILIQGLDGDYNEIEETVTLNGQTQVATQSSYLRLHRAFVTLAGSSGTSGGTIYIGSSGATGGVPNTTVYGSLALGNQTQVAAYTVPAGHTLYLDEINFTAALSTANKRVNISFHSRDFGSNVFRARFVNILQSNQLLQLFKYPQEFKEKTDLECRVSTSTTNNPIAASFQGVLIKNTA